MKRREFITLLGSAAAWPLAARAQQRPKMLRIGTISTLARERPTWRAFEQRLRELGYVEGENLAVDYSIERNFHLYASATQEMIRRKVDIIIATSNDVLKLAMAATNTLPIVMVALDFDPFRLGYLTSVARPTGNVTGVFLQQVGITEARTSGRRRRMLRRRSGCGSPVSNCATCRMTTIRHWRGYRPIIVTPYW